MANPNNLPYLRYQDIQIPDVQIRTQFQQLFQTGQYVQALNLLNNNTSQLQGKAFIANTINTIISSLLILENYYYEGVTVYLSNLAIQYQTMINNFKKRSNWIETVQYTPYNFVVYNNNIYMCIQEPPIGTVPTNETYWLFLGLIGSDGKPGVNVVMEYEWEQETQYQLNDLVIYDGSIYVALKDNVGIIPGTDNTTWMVFIQFDKGQIYIGTNQPNALNNNVIWFQTEIDPNTVLDTTPIIGQFQRYLANESLWDPMYPNTIFNWVDGYSNYTLPSKVLQFNIQISDWNNNEWSYKDNELTEQSLIDVIPNEILNKEQQALYDSLSITISDNTITLVTNIVPNINLPIQLKIIG